MEDKNSSESTNLRAGYPERAIEHFEGYLNSAKIYPKENRDDYWWVWVFQFGDELKEARERGLVTEDEVVSIKKDVSDFMNEGNNLQEFLKAKKAIDKGREKERGEYKLWWQDEEENKLSS